MRSLHVDHAALLTRRERRLCVLALSFRAVSDNARFDRHWLEVSRSVPSTDAQPSTSVMTTYGYSKICRVRLLGAIHQ
jgi:hypothetical protein